MFISDHWKSYELIDAEGGERLERWGSHILVRPDPQVIWHHPRTNPLWNRADGVYRRQGGGGSWVVNRMPESWCVSYPSAAGDLTFRLRPMGFKHTGLFPEQAANWDWTAGVIREALGSGRKTEAPKVLNLFAYTGGATVAAAKAGASLVHVDASKGMTNAARENMQLSGLEDAPCRYIVDDCQKFVAREIRRGNTYDGVIMDPPSYGRGPRGRQAPLPRSPVLPHQFLHHGPLPGGDAVHPPLRPPRRSAKPRRSRGRRDRPSRHGQRTSPPERRVGPDLLPVRGSVSPKQDLR